MDTDKEESTAPINDGAFYIIIEKTYIDCRDIDKIDLLGYTVNKSGELDKNQPVYRITFIDGTYWEKIIDNDTINRFNEYKNFNK
jgi:hypothetical protein